MAAQSSVVRPWRLGGMLLALVPYAALVSAARLAGLSFYPGAVLVATLVFLVYRLFVVRLGLCRDHRRGVLLIRRGKFAEGLAAFEKSERVWERRPTLDRFRAVLLGSATPHRFAILARYNQAYALSRLGRGEECLEKLEATLADDPSMLQARELRDVLLAGSALHPEVGEVMSGAGDDAP